MKLQEILYILNYH